MAGRSTVYNDNLYDEATWKLVNKENKRLYDDFLAYCESCDKSPMTRKQYQNQLRIFFCWNFYRTKINFS